MKTLFLVLSLSTLLAVQAFGQIPTLTIGPGYKTSYRSFINTVIANKSGEYYIVKGKGQMMSLKSTMYLERYNNQMERTFSKVITTTNTNGKRLLYEGIACMDTAPILFSSYFNKEKRTKYAFANEINSEGDVSRQFHVIDKIQDLKRDRLGDFQFSYSGDTTKMLLYKTLTKKGRDKVELLFKVYNKEMALLWQQELSLPYASTAVKITRFKVDNAGNVFMLASVADESKLDSKTGKLQKGANLFKRTNNTYKIFAINPTGEFKEFNVSLGEQYITDITMDFNPKGQLICAGYYGNEGMLGMNGQFYTIVDPNSQKIVYKNIKELDKETLEKLEGKRKAAKKKGLRSMDLDDLLFTKDGRTIMVGEQHYMVKTRILRPQGPTTNITTSYRPSAGGYSTTNVPRTTINTNPFANDPFGTAQYRYDYYYNSLLVTSINADGTIGWTTVVPKRQHSINDNAYYLSFSKIAVGHNLHFVYNDTRKNLNIDEPKKLREARAQALAFRVFSAKTYPVVATIGQDGSLNRQLLVSPKEKLKAMMRPKLSLKITSNELLVSFSKNKLIKFGKVSF